MIATKSRVIQGSPVVLVARISGAGGANMTRADVSSISVTVYDTVAGALVTTLTPAVNDTVYDTLQLDARWGIDAIGFNFAAAVPGAAFPNASRYQVEATVTPSAGAAFRLVWDVQAVAVHP